MRELTTIEELKGCLSASEANPVFLFKHSTVCPVSSSAHQEVKRFLEGEGEAPEFYLVKVIESRPVSGEVAKRIGLTHQSPQLILVKDRSAVWSASHYEITGEAIRSALAQLESA